MWMLCWVRGAHLLLSPAIAFLIGKEYRCQCSLFTSVTFMGPISVQSRPPRWARIVRAGPTEKAISTSYLQQNVA